jgi:hypothetical protein
MSNQHDKLKNSKRRHSDETAVKKQAKIAKAHGAPVEQAHRLHKRHAMDCGNPECFLCGNPRKTHKDKLTQQEKRLFQDTETVRDTHSNGLKPNSEV